MTIPVGVVGAGNIATSRHLPAFENHENFTVRTVSDTSEAKTRTVAGEYDLCSALDLETVCDSVDLVSLCTPPSVHHEQAIEALEAGCHVLCQQPQADCPDDSELLATTVFQSAAVFYVWVPIQYT
jgi:predicted dehydrogenase